MGWIAPALAAVGDAASTAGGAIGSAAGTVGGDVASALGNLGSTSGVTNLAQGVGQLFGGGAPSEAGYLSSLGQAVPQGVDLAGPSATFSGPGFFQGLVEGIKGTAEQLANPTASTQTGQGLGQLFDALNQVRGSAPMPMVNLPPSARMGPATRVMPPAPVVQPQQGPIMGIFRQLFAGF
jgi:hypothetical protein